ncbi:hypothetical protein FOZ60_010433 [Perkinsus olseni]|uniref:Tr-type G domain-containing protein n=1 Tax=Perkinsus olseni TaxID=32597 RepID=A0A7J6NGE0_PEROL|nr:hypothetical protein FOZ60_010433 [Perkinsus olseni]
MQRRRQRVKDTLGVVEGRMSLLRMEAILAPMLSVACYWTTFTRADPPTKSLKSCFDTIVRHGDWWRATVTSFEEADIDAQAGSDVACEAVRAALQRLMGISIRRIDVFPSGRQSDATCQLCVSVYDSEDPSAKTATDALKELRVNDESALMTIESAHRIMIYDTCVFDEGGPLEVVGPRELAFHTGPAVGPHLATYEYNSNSGARAAELTDSGSGDAALPHGPIYAYFNGGACFPESQFPVGCRSEVLYRYASSGEPAILRCPVGRGKAILSGVHFEVMPEDLAELHDTDLSEHEVCELMFRTEKNLKILGSVEGEVASHFTCHMILRRELFAACGDAAARNPFRVCVRQYHKKGSSFLARKTARDTIVKGRESRDKIILVPPYLGASELRLMLPIDYSAALSLCGARQYLKKYYWNDHEGREFETTSKRKVIVPFDNIVRSLYKFGMEPRMIDMEPEWDSENLPIKSGLATKSVPVVVVVGHINHGKTTFLDTLRGTNVVEAEPGHITQSVRAFTMDLPEASHGTTAEQASFDTERMTFIDTPGHAAFETSRGRAVEVADCALVIVSVENGADIQTEEVLLQADAFRVPVVFALNKIDLPYANVELVRNELAYQCAKLYEAGMVSSDFSDAARKAVPISALHGTNITEVVDSLQHSIGEVVAENQQDLPLHRIPAPTVTPGMVAQFYRSTKKRNDYLTDVDLPVTGALVIIDITNNMSQGRIMLCLVKHGVVMKGSFFVAGSAFGQVERMWDADKGTKAEITKATPGMAVQIVGLKKQRRGKDGTCSATDIVMVMAKGTSMAIISADMPRPVDEPVGERAVSRDWLNKDRTVSEYGEVGYNDNRVFKEGAAAEAPREEYEALARLGEHNPLVGFEAEDYEGSVPNYKQMRDFELAEQDTKERLKAEKIRLAKLASGTPHSIVVEPEQKPGRGTSESLSVAVERVLERPKLGRRRWIVQQKRSLPPQLRSKDSIYYVERRNWQEDAVTDTRRIIERWGERDVNNWKEKEEQKAHYKEVKRVHSLREKKITGTTGDGGHQAEIFRSKERNREHREKLDLTEYEDLPEAKLVLPVILKTQSVNVFDGIMDEIEMIEKEFNMRIPIVHGGVGPVLKKDVEHTVVERDYGYCPIYTVQVGVHPTARQHAEDCNVPVKNFDVFTDLLEDIRSRCKLVIERKRKIDQRRQKALWASNVFRTTVLAICIAGPLTMLIWTNGGDEKMLGKTDCSVHSARMLSLHGMAVENGVDFTQHLSYDIGGSCGRVLLREPELCDDSVRQYSGYFTVDPRLNKKYFFWFFEGRNQSRKPPTTLWLSGGPGMSSMLALLMENGPCSLLKNATTTFNPYSWTEASNMLWVDQPPGTGFSTGAYDRDEDEVSEDMYVFLQAFFRRFPKFNDRFFITGESFAGQYVPSLASTIIRKNDEIRAEGSIPGRVLIDFRGMAIGNGVTVPAIQLQFFPQMAYNSTTAPSVVSKETYDKMTRAMAKLKIYLEECTQTSEAARRSWSTLPDICVKAWLTYASTMIMPIVDAGYNK